MATVTAARPERTARRRLTLRWSTFAPRAAIVLVLLGLCAVVASMGAANLLSRSDPRLAARFAPYDARILMAAARATVAARGHVQDPAVRRLTERALARDLTVASAIEYRALQADLDGDDAREARLFKLSAAISRRSLPTRLWLIQQSVDHGDVAGALEDFDIALRTSATAPKMLFPVLARAATDPALAGPIARVLDRPEDWRLMFLNYAISDAHAGPAMADVILRMRDRKAITDGGVDQRLIGELVAGQDFARARQVQDALHPAPAGPALVRDPDFSSPAAAYPFGWSLTESGEIDAVRGRLGRAPVLTYRSEPGGSGPVATQLLTLAPGGYRLQSRTATASSDSAARPYWTLTCAEDGGGQIALLDQPAAESAADGTDFAVAPDCTAQWLTLHLRSSDAPDQSGAIAWVSVARR